jgi:peptidylprolyl isomerase
MIPTSTRAARGIRLSPLLGALALLLSMRPASAGPSAPPPTMDQILATSTAADWRRPDPENILYMDFAAGRVIIELAPQFTPEHVANIRTLVRAHYFDGLTVNRVQDNYVVQWGDADGERGLGDARAKLPAEYARSARGLSFTALPDRDVYAPEAGFIDGFPAARDGESGQAWLAHCYAMVGVGRDMPPDTGNGAELYAVIGHAPRHLDRNLAVVGRVISGMPLMTALPRGTGALGFYRTVAERTTIRSVRLAADVPTAERTDIQLLRTDTPTFSRLMEARRNRREPFFVQPAGHIDLCNVPLPARIDGKA